MSPCSSPGVSGAACTGVSHVSCFARWRVDDRYHVAAQCVLCNFCAEQTSRREQAAYREFLTTSRVPARFQTIAVAKLPRSFNASAPQAVLAILALPNDTVAPPRSPDFLSRPISEMEAHYALHLLRHFYVKDLFAVTDETKTLKTWWKFSATVARAFPNSPWRSATFWVAFEASRKKRFYVRLLPALRCANLGNHLHSTSAPVLVHYNASMPLSRA